jgi:hypothetical protein
VYIELTANQQPHSRREPRVGLHHLEKKVQDLNQQAESSKAFGDALKRPD